jgi:hypothetical protein
MMTLPHCDSSILHAPKTCKFCDMHPEMQEYRQLARIAFTGAENELGDERTAPCPSTHFREPEKRDLWGGNVAQPAGKKFLWF